MSDYPPPKKHPSLTVTSAAIEKLKSHNITKEIVLDVMKNRTDRIQLDDGQFQFIGSAQYPDTYVTARFSPQKQQWVITDIQVRSKVPKSEPRPPVVKRDQRDTSQVAVIFTNHAREVLRREFLDHRVVEHIIQYPDKKFDEEDEKVRFIGWVHGDKLHVIAKFLPEEQKWLVITVELRYEAAAQADVSDFDDEPTDEHPGITFSTHALERMKLRDIYPDEVKQTILYPEKTFEDDEGKVRFIGKPLTQNRAYHAVGKFLPEENKWLVISVWVRGEDDDGNLSTWQPKKVPASNEHLGVAFTNNVREWLKRQQVDGKDVEQVILYPERKLDDKDGKIKFIGQNMGDGRVIHAIGKFIPEENKWLVITAWMSRQKHVTQQSTKKSGSTIVTIFYFMLFVVFIVLYLLSRL